MPHRLRCARLLLLPVLCMLALVGSVRAEDIVRSVNAGDDVKGELSAGDVHAFLVPLVAGSELRLELHAEADEPEEPGKDEPGPSPELVLLSPEGAVLAMATDPRADVREQIDTSGTYRIELRAGTFAGSYELDLDVELPNSIGGGTVQVGGDPVPVHLDVPEGTSVRIDVKRRSGSRPIVVSVRDGLDRELGFLVRRYRKNKLRLHPVPVTAPGGLDVYVASSDGVPSTYEVRAKPTDDDDDEPEDDGDRSERHIIVQLAPGADPQAIADALGYELEEVGDGYAVLETPEGREGFEDDDSRDADERSPDILGAEPDSHAHIPEGSQSNSIVLGSDLGRSEFDLQPALEQVRASAAHRRATGAGVVVAVLDTGIDATHSLFTGRVLPGMDFVGGDGDPSEERNLVDDDGDGEIDEGFGHGTFVAGLVLAAAPDATILPIRVLDSDGRGRASRIAKGVDYAISQGADIINLSLGSRSANRVLAGAVRLALSHGIVVVTATGNRGSTTKVDHPGGVRGAFAVTALTQSRRRAPFANVGGRTALAAPGEELIGPYPGEQWGRWSGTSFSAALTSGAAALVLEGRPAFRPDQVTKRLRVKARGLPGVPRAERKLLGAGRLDLQRVAR